jgi:hypothetical protein
MVRGPLIGAVVVGMALVTTSTATVLTDVTTAAPPLVSTRTRARSRSSARSTVSPRGRRAVGRSSAAAGDGVQHSDGAAVTTTPLGREYPRGLLVVHDGENTPVTPDRGTDTTL